MVCNFLSFGGPVYGCIQCSKLGVSWIHCRLSGMSWMTSVLLVNHQHWYIWGTAWQMHAVAWHYHLHQCQPLHLSLQVDWVQFQLASGQFAKASVVESIQNIGYLCQDQLHSCVPSVSHSVWGDVCKTTVTTPTSSQWGVFISSDFIDLLSSSSAVVFRCLVLRSFMVHFITWASSVLSSPDWPGGWDFVWCPHEWHTVYLRFLALVRFVLLPYGIYCLLFLQSHGLKVVWDGNMCLAHFKHVRCGCHQVECEQLLDEFLVIEGSDKSVLDVLFLFIIWWEVALVSKGMEMVNEFIWWLSRSDVNIFQLIDPTALGYCMIHCRGQVVHEGWSLLFLLWNFISCASWLPMVKLPAAGVAQEIEHIFQSSQVGFHIGV